MAVHGHGQYTGQCAHGPVETRRGVVVSAAKLILRRTGAHPNAGMLHDGGEGRGRGAHPNAGMLHDGSTSRKELHLVVTGVAN